MQRFYTYITNDKDINQVKAVFSEHGFEGDAIVIDTMETRPELRRMLAGKWKDGDELITDSIYNFGSTRFTISRRIRKMKFRNINLRVCDIPELLEGDTDYPKLLSELPTIIPEEKGSSITIGRRKNYIFPKNFDEYYRAHLHGNMSVAVIAYKTGISEGVIFGMLKRYREILESQTEENK